MPDPFSPLKDVSRANLERDVRHLSTAYPTRNTFSKHIDPCADWLIGRLKKLGYKDVSRHTYQQRGKTLPNVIGVKPGKTARTIILCAHFDSRMEDVFDETSPAPGADDNATGVAVVLEIARILQKIPMKDTVRFAFFSGEEQGLWGSAAYAKQVEKEKTDIAFVFNLDQIGYPPKSRVIKVESDQGGRRDNNAASAKLVTRMEELAKTVVKFPTKRDKTWGSDYLPFENLGHTIVGLYEATDDYPDYHKTTDTIKNVDFDYLSDMARLCLATLLDASAV